jgi:hypothetical protein
MRRLVLLVVLLVLVAGLFGYWFFFHGGMVRLEYGIECDSNRVGATTIEPDRTYRTPIESVLENGVLSEFGLSEALHRYQSGPNIQDGVGLVDESIPATGQRVEYFVYRNGDRVGRIGTTRDSDGRYAVSGWISC